MAYKFQLGPAILSGSIQAEEGIVSTDVDDATAANVVAQIDAGEIPIAKLAAKTISGKDLGSNLDALSVANNSGLTMSSYDGSAAVSDLAVEIKANSGLTKDNDGIQVVLDGSGGLEFNASSGIRLEAAVAGAGLAHSSGVLSVRVDDATIEEDSDILRIKAGGLQDSHMNDNVATGLAGAGLSAASGVLAVEVSGAMKVASDKVGVSGSIAEADGGLGFSGGADSISGLRLRGGNLPSFNASQIAHQDEFFISDQGTDTPRKISLEHLADKFSGNALVATNGVVRVVADESTIEVDAGNDRIQIKDNGVTLSKMSHESQGDLFAFGAGGAPFALSKGVANTVLIAGASQPAYGLLADANIDASAAIVDTKLATISTANKVSLAALDLDGGTDIGAALADADLMIVDDGAGGTNRKMAASRIATYAKSKFSAATAGGKAEGSLQYNDGVYTLTQMSVAELRAHLSVADTNSMDMSYSSGQFSADLRLASSDALEIGGSGLELKSTIAGSRVFSNDVTITGNLTVNGTQTILNTATLEVEDLNIKVAKDAANSAAADGAGLTIEMGSDDLTFAWEHATQQMQLKLGSAFADIKANKFIGDIVGAVQQAVNGIGDADGNLVVGFNYGSADTTAARTWTLPASPSEGQVVHVKAPSSMHASGIKIVKSGSQTIDGEVEITLESPFAAVNIMYVGSNAWRVF